MIFPKTKGGYGMIVAGGWEKNRARVVGGQHPIARAWAILRCGSLRAPFFGFCPAELFSNP